MSLCLVSYLLSDLKYQQRETSDKSVNQDTSRDVSELVMDS